MQVRSRLQILPLGQCVPLLQQTVPSGAHVPSRHNPQPGRHCAYAGDATSSTKPIKEIPSAQRIAALPFQAVLSSDRIYWSERRLQHSRRGFVERLAKFFFPQLTILPSKRGRSLLAGHKLIVVALLHFLSALCRWRTHRYRPSGLNAALCTGSVWPCKGVTSVLPIGWPSSTLGSSGQKHAHKPGTANHRTPTPSRKQTPIQHLE